MKTLYFKINDFDLNRDYNDYFWNRLYELALSIRQGLANNRNSENYRVREDDLNIKLIHIFHVLKKYVEAKAISLPSNIWIGFCQYSAKFKNNRNNSLGYISGDFDFLVGGIEGLSLQTDNIIGIETKVFRYGICNFDENYRTLSEIPDFKLKSHLKNDGIMPGLKQIISYKNFCNKVILLYFSATQPISGEKIFAIGLNADTIRKTMWQIKNKYQDKFVHIPEDIGFCIGGIVQVPGRDSLDSGTPTTPEIITNPTEHNCLLSNREDFIEEIKRRLEKAISV